MPQGLESILCVGTQLRQSHMQGVGNEWQSRKVLDCAGLEGQHKDSDWFNKVVWSHGRVCLHEQTCPLGRLIRRSCGGWMRAGGERV